MTGSPKKAALIISTVPLMFALAEMARRQTWSWRLMLIATGAAMFMFPVMLHIRKGAERDARGKKEERAALDRILDRAASKPWSDH